MPAELKGCVTWFISFWIFLKKGMTVQTFIMVGCMWQILGRWAFLAPHPWAAPPKSPSWIGLKDISRVLLNFSCLYPYHAYFILLHKSQKCITERNKNKRLNVWSLFINWVTQFLKMICARSYVWLLSFIKGLDCFLKPNVSPKLSKMTVTCPKSVKINKKGRFRLVQSHQNYNQFKLLKVSKVTSLKIYISLVMEKPEISDLDSR